MRNFSFFFHSGKHIVKAACLNKKMLEKTSASPDITVRIENGSYFTEARKWYDIVYNAPLAHRSFLILIFSISVGIITYAYFAVKAMFPIVTFMSLPVKFNDTLRYEYNITRMAERYKDSNPALIDFHVKDYVRAYETYIVKDIEKNFRRVMSLSTRSAFEEYQKFMDPRNPGSPISLYERQASRYVNITGVVLSSSKGLQPKDDNYISDTAKVYFDVTIINLRNEKKTENWVADFTFIYDSLEVDQETTKVKPMQFLVSSYRSSRALGE